MRYFYFFSFLFAGAACGPQPANTSQNVPASIDVTLLDSSFIPADDFFEFVNHRWISTHPIPPSKSAWGAFHELQEKNKLQVKEILEEAETQSLLGKFWQSAMDTLSIENNGLAPFTQLRRQWNYGNKPETRGLHYAQALAAGMPLPFTIYVDQDLKNNQRHALYIVQDGLGLPEKEYYFRKDARSQNIRKKYHAFIQQLLQAAGTPQTQARTQAIHVLNIERALAKTSMSVEEMRNQELTYNPFSIQELQLLTPHFQWNTFFSVCGIHTDTVILGQPAYFEDWNHKLNAFSQEQWNAYYAFHELREAAPFLHRELVHIHFDFYGKTLSGKTEMEPRWQQVVSQADYLLRDLVGQEYVKRKFNEHAKTQVLDLVNNLKKAFDARIQRLDWMTETTKTAAREKLQNIMVKMGYPDQWRSYEGLELNHEAYLLNVSEAEAFDFQRMLRKLNHAIDRSEWYMGPQTVNAYYNPTMNEIVFPAAILQPPFFHPDADPAVNYGGIGMVIGHELTHGFDDQGRRFDALGNFRNWWAAEDENKFNALAQRFIQFYETYKPLDSISINGKLTLGENIADLGGLLIAWDAFQLLPQKERSQSIDGLTPNERFFISFAQIWRGHQRDESLVQRLYTDVHAPGKYRVIGVLSNSPAFYETFHVQPGHKLYVPEAEQCKLW